MRKAQLPMRDWVQFWAVLPMTGPIDLHLGIMFGSLATHLLEVFKLNNILHMCSVVYVNLLLLWQNTRVEKKNQHDWRQVYFGSWSLMFQSTVNWCHWARVCGETAHCSQESGVEQSSSSWQQEIKGNEKTRGRDAKFSRTYPQCFLLLLVLPPPGSTPSQYHHRLLACESLRDLYTPNYSTH